MRRRSTSIARGLGWIELFLLVMLTACRADNPEPRGTSSARPTAKEGPVQTKLETHLIHGERAGAPVVIVMHGYGAGGDDLVPLAQWLGTRTRFRYLAAEAPLALPFGGRAWWNIDMAAREAKLRSGEGLDFRSERPDGVDEARDRVLALIEEVRRTMQVGPNEIALLGFSQGAMLAMETALHLEAGPRCLALLSGTYLSESVWKPRMAARRATPVFMSHGKADPILPFANSVALKDELERSGYSVSFTPFSGGHEIPRQVADDLAAFLERCFPASAP